MYTLESNWVYPVTIGVFCYFLFFDLSWKCLKQRNENRKEMLWAVNNKLFHDVVFVVGDKRFAAHKVVLCARSPYFKALFTSGLKVDFFSFLSSK